MLRILQDIQDVRVLIRSKRLRLECHLLFHDSATLLDQLFYEYFVHQNDPFLFLLGLGQDLFVVVEKSLHLFVLVAFDRVVLNE